jgi:hypothetical protein
VAKVNVFFENKIKINLKKGYQANRLIGEQQNSRNCG